jgi:hypothetical protein
MTQEKYILVLIVCVLLTAYSVIGRKWSWLYVSLPGFFLSGFGIALELVFK